MVRAPRLDNESAARVAVTTPPVLPAMVLRLAIEGVSSTESEIKSVEAINQ